MWPPPKSNGSATFLGAPSAWIGMPKRSVTNAATIKKTRRNSKLPLERIDVVILEATLNEMRWDVCWAPTSGYNGRLDHGRRPAWVNRFDQRSDPRDVRTRHGCPGHELIRMALGRQDADSGSSYVRLFKQNKGFDAFGRAAFLTSKKKGSCWYDSSRCLITGNCPHLREFLFSWDGKSHVLLVLRSRSLNFQTAHSDP